MNVNAAPDLPDAAAELQIPNSHSLTYHLHNSPLPANNTSVEATSKESVYERNWYVKRVDDLGRIVIPKGIRRILRIIEGNSLLKTLTVNEKYLWAMKILHNRIGVH